MSTDHGRTSSRPSFVQRIFTSGAPTTWEAFRSNMVYCVEKIDLLSMESELILTDGDSRFHVAAISRDEETGGVRVLLGKQNVVMEKP